MKKTAIVLGVIFFLMAGFSMWYMIGGTLRAEVTVTTTEADDDPQILEAVREAMEDGSAPQTFAAAVPDVTAGYRLVDVTISLHNRGLFAAEWLHTQARPEPGDVAVYALIGEGSDIPAHSSGVINLKLLTSAQPEAERHYVVEYYVWGMKRRIEVK